ncbi:MAG: hypothetical protein WKF59_19710 [Chitinophagaceae bacterium]
MLAHHYLGRKYFSDKKPEQAEKYLTEAIRRYIPADSFMLFIKSEMETSLQQNIKDSPRKNTNRRTVVPNQTTDSPAIYSGADTSCLLSILMYYHYDELEDHYILGNIYEQQGKFDEALNQYEIIAAKENEKLMAQAIYKGYKKIMFENENSYVNHEEKINFYESPVRAGGTLKAARLLEKKGRYEEAEDILLQQVHSNRKAGYARQEEMNKRNFGPSGPTPYNYFWLKANYDLEAETYNFYTRMLALFPRNAGWYRKAGMFLYERLFLTYSVISIAEQKAFYEYSKTYSYPYKGSEEHTTEGFDEDGKYFSEVNKFKLPGTNEELSIEMKGYDPLKTSISFLENAIKFSGDLKPKIELTEAIANLEKWRGNNEAAITGFNNLVNLQPENNKVRNTLIELLEFNKNLPAAAVQLDSLQRRKALSNEQIIRLAYYKILSHHAKDGLPLLKEYVPHTLEEKNLKTSLLIQHFMMTGQLKNALSYLRDSLQTPEKPNEELTEEPVAQIVAFDTPYYTEARILAMTNQDVTGFCNGKRITGFRLCVQKYFNE